MLILCLQPLTHGFLRGNLQQTHFELLHHTAAWRAKHPLGGDSAQAQSRHCSRGLTYRDCEINSEDNGPGSILTTFSETRCLPVGFLNDSEYVMKFGCLLKRFHCIWREDELEQKRTCMTRAAACCCQNRLRTHDHHELECKINLTAKSTCYLTSNAAIPYCCNLQTWYNPVMFMSSAK